MEPSATASYVDYWLGGRGKRRKVNQLVVSPFEFSYVSQELLNQKEFPSLSRVLSTYCAEDTPLKTDNLTTPAPTIVGSSNLLAKHWPNAPVVIKPVTLFILVGYYIPNWRSNLIIAATMQISEGVAHLLQTLAPLWHVQRSTMTRASVAPTAPTSPPYSSLQAQLEELPRQIQFLSTPFGSFSPSCNRLRTGSYLIPCDPSMLTIKGPYLSSDKNYS